MQINNFKWFPKIMDAMDIEGSDITVGKGDNKHGLPIRKDLTLNDGFNPRDAQRLRDEEAKSWDAIGDLTGKVNRGEDLTDEEQKLLENAERRAAVSGDLLKADAKWDTEQSENGHPEYAEGKRDYFEMTDELRNMGNIYYPD